MYICAECYGGPEHVGGNQLKGKEKKKSIQKIKEKRKGKKKMSTVMKKMLDAPLKV